MQNDPAQLLLKKQLAFSDLLAIIEGLEKEEIALDEKINTKIQEKADEAELKALADKLYELNIFIQEKLKEKSDLGIEIIELQRE